MDKRVPLSRRNQGGGFRAKLIRRTCKDIPLGSRLGCLTCRYPVRRLSAGEEPSRARSSAVLPRQQQQQEEQEQEQEEQQPRRGGLLASCRRTASKRGAAFELLRARRRSSRRVAMRPKNLFVSYVKKMTRLGRKKSVSNGLRLDLPARLTFCLVRGRRASRSPHRIRPTFRAYSPKCASVELIRAHCDETRARHSRQTCVETIRGAELTWFKNSGRVAQSSRPWRR